ncbi:MAG TPA: hypothetical protein VFH59_07775 [Frateuria sp.]|uniref:hypothetical protein n=1 Tax=Frateuria sp. TaxID=2211372 RepID=UPI002D7F3710|nr:hypothetical protein [Frateuria sp.]HET6805320.1 hypothetical protein [Frateuria sp.]
MAKASINDVLDEGFNTQQFGAPGDWSDPATGYLARVLANAGRWVEAKMGAPVYAALAADSYANDCAAKAEVQYASAELFRRRYAFVEAGASAGMNKDQATLLAELRRKSAEALQNATYWLGEALRASGVDDGVVYEGSGLASGMVETGRYPPISEVAP